jgi:hypothetical protein
MKRTRFPDDLLTADLEDEVRVTRNLSYGWVEVKPLQEGYRCLS